jgi:adenine-specific DNA-methyltransferase
MKSQHRRLTYTVIQEDFVLRNGDALTNPPGQQFDVVISNPPYLKLPKSDPRVQLAEPIVHGQPNLYALFMAVGAALLQDGGHTLFITPRSYAAGQYFSRFRDYFFSRMRPRAFHLFESRRDVFDEVLQESLVTLAERSTRDRDVILSSSPNFSFHPITRRTRSIDEVLSADGVVHLPISDEDHAVTRIVHSWTGSLHQYGMEISTGPVVPFRAANWVVSEGDISLTHAPLFWMQNVRPMDCTWPVSREGQYLTLDGANKLLLPNRNYVLLRRFTAKEERQRLVAAPYLTTLNSRFIGLENHLNYIYKPDGELSADETRGLAVLLNSSLMDTYFRIFSGNTQVSATELRKLPLPPLNAITEMGRLAAASRNPDTLINEVFGLYA